MQVLTSDASRIQKITPLHLNLLSKKRPKHLCSLFLKIICYWSEKKLFIRVWKEIIAVNAVCHPTEDVTQSKEFSETSHSGVVHEGDSWPTGEKSWSLLSSLRHPETELGSGIACPQEQHKLVCIWPNLSKLSTLDLPLWCSRTNLVAQTLTATFLEQHELACWFLNTSQTY